MPKKSRNRLACLTSAPRRPSRLSWPTRRSSAAPPEPPELLSSPPWRRRPRRTALPPPSPTAASSLSPRGRTAAAALRRAAAHANASHLRSAGQARRSKRRSAEVDRHGLAVALGCRAGQLRDRIEAADNTPGETQESPAAAGRAVPPAAVGEGWLAAPRRRGSVAIRNLATSRPARELPDAYRSRSGAAAPAMLAAGGGNA